MYLQRWGTTWKVAENSRIGQNGGHLHSAQGGLALIDRESANRGSSAARGILVRNLSQWVERALEYGIFRNELFFLSFDGFFEILLLEAEADQMLHSPGTSFVLNYLGTINEGSRSLFFS